MTKKPSKKIVAALATYAAAYSECFKGRVAGDFQIALSFAIADMLNQVKGQTEANAVFLINDEAAYMLEKRAA